MNKPKLLVILGPTASGKSSLAIDLAKKYNGEVISADSRQVYKGLTIGTGKVTKKEMRGVKHHMLDIVNPKKQFTVAEFQLISHKIITDIHLRNKLPILCGGTGFYIQSIVDNISLPEVLPNQPLRNKLEKKTNDELIAILAKLDPARVQTIDKTNRRKIIRAIEIAKTLGKVPPVIRKSIYDTLQIGIKHDDETLKLKIKKRLAERIKKGMVKEAIDLHKKGLSWKRMEELGLEYRYLALYLQGKISKKEMMQTLETEIWHYARRQKTWFKKDVRIKWFTLDEIDLIEKEVDNFIAH